MSKENEVIDTKKAERDRDFEMMEKRKRAKINQINLTHFNPNEEMPSGAFNIKSDPRSFATILLCK